MKNYQKKYFELQKIILSYFQSPGISSPWGHQVDLEDSALWFKFAVVQIWSNFLKDWRLKPLGSHAHFPQFSKHMQQREEIVTHNEVWNYANKDMIWNNHYDINP